MHQRPVDYNFLFRFFYIHCFVHIFRVLSCENANEAFTPPRFELFREIKLLERKSNALFKSLLWTFKWELIAGGIITIIFASLNLLVPKLIKMFMHFLHGHHESKDDVAMAENFIRNLVCIQILRLIFGEHSKRLFHELAIMIESTLAKMLVCKSLRLSPQARKDIPHSELIQLQNVDLRLVFTMFSNMHLIFEAPFTILVAIIMLFAESRTYGIIGIYWFLIAFFMQRELEDRMASCNSTKLGLIEQRSKINYQMLDCIKEAKMIGWENIIVEKNNDLFEHQNHDHYIFYFYNSLFDIILLMLPVLVVVTIAIYDMGEKKHITVEQVYLMLSLLELCYEPMKSTRTIIINFHDGLRSLLRINQYFNMPEHHPVEKLGKNIERGHIVIEKKTKASYQDCDDFYLSFKHQVEVNPGERIVILGRRGQGRLSLFRMLTGYMNIYAGEVRMRGNLAQLSSTFFFTKGTVKENIVFFHSSPKEHQITKLFHSFGLADELKSLGGLNASMEDINLFTKSQLQKIGILRVLMSNANIYLLDCPFQYLDKDDEVKFEKLLRQKQKEGVAVLVKYNYLQFMKDEDKILLISGGRTQQYDTYQSLKTNSRIHNFFTSKSESVQVKPNKHSQEKNPKEQQNKKVFKAQILPIQSLVHLIKKKNEVRSGVRLFEDLLEKVKMEKVAEKKQIKEKSERYQLMKYLSKYIGSVPTSEIIIILIIILYAQLLHVFIHYWIGHLEEEHGETTYDSFQSMIIVEVMLTFGLAGVLYYEGDVSSWVAIIQGNNLYSKSLHNLVAKDIDWFANEYSVKIADKFNHDYEQIFIGLHSVLGIYKNVIILFITITWISSDGLTVILTFSFVAGLYLSILWLFRTVEKKVVKYFYHFKYQYVRHLEESIQGAEIFSIFHKNQHLIRSTEHTYRRLASYKLAERYTSYGLSIVCDLMSVLLLAATVSYGLDMKMHHSGSNIALVATSIHLLMNGSQVLKSIVKDTIKFESFFSINIIPFMALSEEDGQHSTSQSSGKSCLGKDFHLTIREAKITKETNTVLQPLNFSIREREQVLIYAPNDHFRKTFMQALTKNYSIADGDIEIGGVNIKDISRQDVCKTVGVITAKNFYMSGTLRENLVWNAHEVDEAEIEGYVKLLKLDADFDDYEENGLDTMITFENNRVNNEITKKLAVIRLLIAKPKIVIIKDVASFLGSLSFIEDIFKKLDCTIIKISNKVECSLDVQRIIYVKDHRIMEDGNPHEIREENDSELGRELNDANLEGYVYMNQVSRGKKQRGGKR